MIIPVIIKLEEDIRERIIYLAHMTIETTISYYSISKKDIDYPQKLIDYYEEKEANDKEVSIYSIWFLPVQKVLKILSLLYTCIDVGEFIHSFTHSLIHSFTHSLIHSFTHSSSLHLFISSSLHLFISSSLHLFISSSLPLIHYLTCSTLSWPT